MSNIVSNQLFIEGSEENINKFIEEYYINKIWNIPCREMKDFNFDYNSCFLSFITELNPSHIWLKEVRGKYLSLQFFLWWTKPNTPPWCGIIDGSEEYTIKSIENFKLACKLLTRHQEIISVKKDNIRTPEENIS
jgi:hypothetical protein